LLIELLHPIEGDLVETYRRGPFRYAVKKLHGVLYYEVVPEILPDEIMILRRTVEEVSSELRPETVEPFTFEGLIETIRRAAAAEFSRTKGAVRAKALSDLAAFEAIGLPTIFALALDGSVTEFYADSRDTPLYFDHYTHGRCESQIVLTDRECKAIETHMDTFKGYTLDFATPSLKNELEVAGARLRVSLDLAPLAVNGFSLDVRKLTSYSLGLNDLIATNALTPEAAAFLLAGLQVGLNITIVGETGTGKTTLLNVLDESLDPRLRRVYIEDAVETKDLLHSGYHQMKLRVDPFEKTSGVSRTKAAEIVKILHRSPDLVILGEIQSREHSTAFFHALTAGVRGMQTFHSSSPETALRRWIEVHGIPKANILDLDVIVLMTRPERLASSRLVSRIALVVDEGGEPRLRDVYIRDAAMRLRRITPWERVEIRSQRCRPEEFAELVRRIESRLGVAQAPEVN
jgi:pilus assembly protein CpaF